MKIVPTQVIGKVQNAEYLHFFKRYYQLLEVRYPKRNSQELTKAASLEWKRSKKEKKMQNKSSQREGIQRDGALEKKQRIVEIHGQKYVLPNLPVKAFQRYVRSIKQDYFKDGQTADQRVSLPDFGRLASERWRGLSAEEKAPFHKSYDEDMVKYRRELSNFQARHGIIVKRASNNGFENAKRKCIELKGTIQQDQEEEAAEAKLEKKIKKQSPNKKEELIAIEQNPGQARPKKESINKIFEILNQEVPYEFLI